MTYPNHNLELAAVIFALKIWRHYIVRSLICSPSIKPLSICHGIIFMSQSQWIDIWKITRWRSSITLARLMKCCLSQKSTSLVAHLVREWLLFEKSGDFIRIDKLKVIGSSIHVRPLSIKLNNMARLEDSYLPLFMKESEKKKKADFAIRKWWYSAISGIPGEETINNEIIKKEHHSWYIIHSWNTFMCPNWSEHC